jgi:hypothetical protein
MSSSFVNDEKSHEVHKRRSPRSPRSTTAIEINGRKIDEESIKPLSISVADSGNNYNYHSNSNSINHTNSIIQSNNSNNSNISKTEIDTRRPRPRLDISVRGNNNSNNTDENYTFSEPIVIKNSERHPEPKPQPSINPTTTTTTNNSTINTTNNNTNNSNNNNNNNNSNNNTLSSRQVSHVNNIINTIERNESVRNSMAQVNSLRKNLKTVNPFLDTVRLKPHTSDNNKNNENTKEPTEYINNNSNSNNSQNKNQRDYSYSEDELLPLDISRTCPNFTLMSSNLQKRYYQMFNQKIAELSTHYPSIVIYNEDFAKRMFEMNLIDVHTIYYEYLDKIKDSKYAYYIKYVCIGIWFGIELFGIKLFKLPLQGFTYRCTKNLVLYEDMIIEISKDLVAREEEGVAKRDPYEFLITSTILQLIFIVGLNYLCMNFKKIAEYKPTLESIFDNYVVGKSTLTESFDEFTKFAPSVGNLGNVLGTLGKLFNKPSA